MSIIFIFLPRRRNLCNNCLHLLSPLPNPHAMAGETATESSFCKCLLLSLDGRETRGTENQGGGRHISAGEASGRRFDVIEMLQHKPCMTFPFPAPFLDSPDWTGRLTSGFSWILVDLCAGKRTVVEAIVRERGEKLGRQITRTLTDVIPAVAVLPGSLSPIAFPSVTL